MKLPLLFALFVIVSAGHIVPGRNLSEEIGEGAVPPRSFRPDVVGRSHNVGLDPTFAAGLSDGISQTYVSTPLSDGKMLIGGTFTLVSGTETAYLARLNADGSLDNTFNGAGSGPDGAVIDIALLPDGRILIGGNFLSYNGSPVSRIARLNADGTLDQTFNSGGSGLAGSIGSVQLDPDGHILVSGQFSSYNGVERAGVVRLFPNGSLDTSYSTPISSSGYVEDVFVLPDGRMMACGVFFIGTVQNLARLFPDGSLDQSFNPGGSGVDPEGFIFAMGLQPDGKIIIGGTFTSYNNVPAIHIARLTMDGLLDNSFSNFLEGNTGIEWIDILPDGKILVAGGIGFGDNAPLARLNPNGSIDTTFTVSNTDDKGYRIARRSDGKIVLSGYFSVFAGLPALNVVLLNEDGSRDNGFEPNVSKFADVFATTLQPDGKILVAGNFTRANGVPRARMARFNTDGTLDLTFDPGQGTERGVEGDRRIERIVLQADGKILIAGMFLGGITRLESNGSVDPSFHPYYGDFINQRFHDIYIRPDGRIMVSGYTINSSIARNLFRLFPDGTEDPTFAVRRGSSIAFRMLPLAGGKMLLAGSFSNYDGQPAPRIIRVNEDGSRDTSFNPGTGANSTVFSLCMATDGRIIIGGTFTSFNGSTRGRIAALNPVNGTLDPAFDTGPGANALIRSVNCRGDGKIDIGGSFSSFDGVPINRLARLSNAGEIDPSFVSGFDNDPRFLVRNLLAQPDGKLIVGGVFQSYNGQPRSSILRLRDDGSTTAAASFDYDGDGKTDISVFRPTDGNWYLQRSRDGFFGTNFGISTDKIVPADYDGDGRTDVAVYRPQDGNWYIANSGNGTYSAVSFGLAEDLPAPGDYDGDGRADVAVFRPSNGTWYIANSSNGSYTIVQFGTNGDLPTLGDFDGDGKADIAVYRPTTGTWYQIYSGNSAFFGEQFGSSEDRITPGDYDGDGKTDLAVYRPMEGVWYAKHSSSLTYHSTVFGLGSDVPASGDYDGDGKDDVAVFRPSDGHWYITNSGNGSFTIYQWGVNGDRPTPSAFGN